MIMISKATDTGCSSPCMWAGQTWRVERLVYDNDK